MSRLGRFSVLVLSSLLVAVPAGEALGAKAPKINKKHLWATINACDTAAHPNELGLRASIPGDGRRARMYMKFRVQYLDPKDASWHNIKATDSGYTYVGSARYASRQAGRYIPFDPPAAGTNYVLRGKVWFRWTKNGKSYRNATRITTSGHKSTAGADPKDYSADICTVT